MQSACLIINIVWYFQKQCDIDILTIFRKWYDNCITIYRQTICIGLIMIIIIIIIIMRIIMNIKMIIMIIMIITIIIMRTVSDYTRPLSSLSKTLLSDLKLYFCQLCLIFYRFSTDFLQHILQIFYAYSTDILQIFYIIFYRYSKAYSTDILQIF